MNRIGIDEKKALKIVSDICNMDQSDCKSLNKRDLAYKLFDLIGIAHDVIDVWEIPLDWDNQVVVCFAYNDKDYELQIAKNSCIDGEFFADIREWSEGGDGKAVTPDFFRKEGKTMCNKSNYMNLMKEYTEYDRIEKAAKAEKAKLKEELIAYMMEECKVIAEGTKESRILDSDGIKATYTVYLENRFDSKLFKSENPKVYDKYKSMQKREKFTCN